MFGYTGIIKVSINVRQIIKMNDIICHRGQDD